MLEANEAIKANVVHYVDADRNMWRLPKEQALAMARERGLDLVVINRQSDPPVCVALSLAKIQTEHAETQGKTRAAQAALRRQGRAYGIEESARLLDRLGYQDLATEVRRLLHKPWTP